MPTHWMHAYKAAIREHAPEQIEERYELARLAIHKRVLELTDDPADARERGELDEALRQLTIHKYKIA